MFFLQNNQDFAEINVLASIQPIHSLVAMVMNGIAEPKLILEGTGSPHTYSLTPSKARDIQNADLIFWIGPQIETFLIKVILCFIFLPNPTPGSKIM